ncbi:MAG: hypothetical protein JNM24_17445 [Bdellovibrionaceae bacterium]|nr:hypothetical protein [Pseudobdellovibrionaceae bacterium]
MKLATFLFTFYMSCFAISAPAWTLTVVYPDQEKKEFLIPVDTDFPVKMNGSKWKCAVDKGFEQNGAISRGISCRKNGDMLGTPVTCDPNLKGAESGLFTLIEGKKQHTFVLTCSK